MKKHTVVGLIMVVMLIGGHSWASVSVSDEVCLEGTLSWRANGVEFVDGDLWIPDVSDDFGDAEVFRVDPVMNSVVDQYAQSHYSAYVSNVAGVAYDPVNEWLWNSVYPGGFMYAVDVNPMSSTYKQEVASINTGLAWLHDLTYHDGHLYASRGDQYASAYRIYQIVPTTGAITGSFTSPTNDLLVFGITIDDMGDMWIADGDFSADGVVRLYQVDLAQALVDGHCGNAIRDSFLMPNVLQPTGSGYALYPLGRRIAWDGGGFWATGNDLCTGVYRLTINSTQPDIIYVDVANTTGTENGSVQYPYDTIQEGIDAAVDGNIVLVGAGNYVGPGNRNLSFSGKLITVESLCGAEMTVIDCEDLERGCSFVSGETSQATLRGFTITRGLAPYPGGGGIYIDGASPTIEDCIFDGNSTVSSAYGGGIHVRNGSPEIAGCDFSGNIAPSTYYGGGGLYVYGSASSPSVIDCTFTGNEAYAGGGIAAQTGPNVTITSCKFEVNKAQSDSSEEGPGGAVYGQASIFTVTGCEFINNDAKQGGALYASSSGPHYIENSIFDGNVASEQGGGALDYANCTSTTVNTLFMNNTAYTDGGAADVNQGVGRFIHCTFSGNSTSGSGGGIGFRGGVAGTVTNSILWGDAPDEIYLETGSTATVTYSNVQGGWPGDGNKNADPMFADAAAGDYHLLPGSECIGTGNTEPDIPYDIEGNPRPAPAGTPPDMGAYESPLGPNSPPVLVVDNPVVSVAEGSVAINTGSVIDPDGDEVNLSREPIGAIAPTTILGSGNFTWTYTPSDGPNDSQEVTITADDNVNNPVDETFTLEVLNVAPTVGDILAPIEPVEMGTQVLASASFTDPGTTDTHIATWDWGDDSTSEGVVDETNGSGTVTGTHSYTTPGVYTLTLTVTDDDGDSGESTYQFVVVYDPDGGFVTGGGWIQSPEGAYADDPDLTGKANFGFVSKYKKGASTPTGQTEFNFKVADLNFHSSAYEWLVVNQADSRAQYKGIGTVNGENAASGSPYHFMLWGVDDDDASDTFRIKIWDEVDTIENVLYDNGVNQEIGGGNIKVHKPAHAAPSLVDLTSPVTQASSVEARPTKTVLLRNYPNPFNPETWIPYHLATDAEVVIRLYNAQGQLVRQLDLGQQFAGYYVERDAAAYWDGRNNLGETVTSGLYFYQLTTDHFTAVRRMLILR